MPLVTLTTDYGTRDPYVGAMKGVLKSLAPKVEIIDITHEIEPHNVVQGAYVLQSVWPYYPVGTIHVAVVDPGVGSDRRILLGRYSGRYVIAPDNGLITLVHRSVKVEEMWVVENRRYFLPELSSTFHGRDVFAPVAAHLANGVKTREFGRSTTRVEMLPVPHRGETLGRRVIGQAVYVDRFGTLVTSINRQDLLALAVKDRDAEVLVNGENIGPIRSFFGAVPAGEPVALIGSTGHVEIAVNQGRAIDRFSPKAEAGGVAVAGSSLLDAIRVEIS